MAELCLAEGATDYQTRFRNGQRYPESVAIVLPFLYHGSADSRATLCRTASGWRPVKAAILRSSRRLGLPFNRTKDIWYGDARRIDAAEMDRLRSVAEGSEIARAIAGIELLKNRMMVSLSPTSHQVVAELNAALRALGRE